MLAPQLIRAPEPGNAVRRIEKEDARDDAELQRSAADERPAWLAPAATQPEPAAPTGRIAILSGALDRQTLYQLGAARSAMPFLQLDFSNPGITESALAWAAE